MRIINWRSEKSLTHDADSSLMQNISIYRRRSKTVMSLIPCSPLLVFAGIKSDARNQPFSTIRWIFVAQKKNSNQSRPMDYSGEREGLFFEWLFPLPTTYIESEWRAFEHEFWFWFCERFVESFSGWCAVWWWDGGEATMTTRGLVWHSNDKSSLTLFLSIRLVELCSFVWRYNVDKTTVESVEDMAELN